MTSNTQPEADTSRAKQQNTVWSVDGAEKSSALPNEKYQKVKKGKCRLNAPVNNNKEQKGK